MLSFTLKAHCFGLRFDSAYILIRCLFYPFPSGFCFQNILASISYEVLQSTTKLLSYPSFYLSLFRFDSIRFVSFHFISFHFISFRFISFHFISSHLISSHLISFHLISFRFDRSPCCVFHDLCIERLVLVCLFFLLLFSSPPPPLSLFSLWRASAWVGLFRWSPRLFH